MKRNIIMCIIFLVIIVSILFFINTNKSINEVKDKYRELESMLIPITEQGNIDFDAMDIKDHQHVAYCLKAEARLGENKECIKELTQYLVNHADDNMDGEIGWGLGYAWNGFSANNPERHVYAIQIVNVIDAYIDALNSGCLSEELSKTVKIQLHDIVLLWNQKYWSENGRNTGKIIETIR